MPSAVLLVVQLLCIALYPFLEDSEHRGYSVTLGLIGIVVLFLAIMAVRPTPSTTWVSILLGVPMVLLTLVDAATTAVQPWHLLNDILHALFYMWTGVALVRYLFADHIVSTDEMFSVGATFTVWVWAFAYIYSIIQTIVPGSFSGELSWMDLLFLSGTTMTNTGLSDIVPVKPNARAIVMLQEFAGIMYLALVVGRVVNVSSAVLGRNAAAGEGASVATSVEPEEVHAATTRDCAPPPPVA